MTEISYELKVGGQTVKRTTMVLIRYRDDH